ncbi:MAG: iron ABC transporter permease [Chloroflexi bacterium]|nr:MAG: iron ABC transporter permease [Chloroflexota bacterium]
MTSAGVAARRMALRAPSLRADVVLVGVAVAVLAYLTVVPLAMLLLGAVSRGGSILDFRFTTQWLERVLTDDTSVELLFNSVIYAAGAAVVAFAVGTAVAWAVERTDVPLRSLWYGIALVPLIVPGIIHTIAWLFLLSPEIGCINVMLRAAGGPTLSAYTLPGMIWIEGLHTAPLAFVLMSAAFRTMDPSLEEAASASRANPWQTLRRVTLPLLLPVSASVLLILFVRSLEGFEVPAIIGLPGRIFVYSSRVYTALKQYPPNFGLMAAYAAVLLAICVIGLVLHRRVTRHAERFATITGKAYRPRRVELGRMRYLALAGLAAYAVVAIGLPFLVLVYTSLVPVSLMLGVSSATIVVIVTAVIAWITVRTRLPGRGLLDFLAFVPIAIPGIVMGVSLMWVYFTLPIPIYGTIWILLIAYVTRYLPYGIRSLTGGLTQIHRELEEASAAAGARWWPTFRRVTVPLLRPTLLAAWIYVFIVSLRELSAGILLYSSNSVVLAIRIFDLRENGNYTAIAALSVMMVTVLVVLVAALQRLGGRSVRES